MDHIVTQLDHLILVALRTGASIDALVAQLEHHAEKLRIAAPLIKATQEAKRAP